MSIDKDTVTKVARLARIAIDDSQKEALAGELTGIMSWIDQLSEVDVEGVEPMTTPVSMTLHQRQDEITDGNRQADVLKNAPRSEDGFYVVPKAVE